MTDKEVGINRRRAEVDVEEAPLTRAILDAHPEMWSRISSVVPAGWDQEIANALQAIMALAGETGVEIRVAQIKSKLAGLRLYLDIDEESAGPIEFVDSTPISTQLRSSSKKEGLRERATAIVDAASGRCETRCELCGEAGVLRNESGWLRIARSAHALTN